jgi:hypothetical protein
MDSRSISADSPMLICESDFAVHLSSKDRQVWRQARDSPPPALRDPSVSGEVTVGAAGRPGEWDPAERLNHMDIDGLDIGTPPSCTASEPPRS